MSANAELLWTLNQLRCPYKARMFLSTNSTAVFTNGTNVAVPYDTVDYDPLSSLTTGTTPTYSVPATGLYVVSASVMYGLTGTASATAVNITIFKNGAETIRGEQTPLNPNVGVANNQYHVSAVGSFVQGDSLQIRGFQNTGGNLAAIGDTTGSLTWASFHYLGPI